MKKWIASAVTVVSIMCFTGIAFAAVTMITQPLYPKVWPVKITKPGSYQLISNLTVPNANTTAILVTADNVTIDLNGFAIIGPEKFGTGKGIDASPQQNIKVYNGTVRGMGDNGIQIGDGIIENVRVLNNGAIGIYVSANYNTGIVNGNTAILNSVTGIYIAGNGTVNGNTANYNTFHGIEVDGDGTFSGNKAIGNGGHGIFVAGYGTVTGNTAIDNNSSGIFIFSGMVSGNTVANNLNYGLELITAGYDHNALVNNRIGNVVGGFNLGQNVCETEAVLGVSALCP